MQYDLSQRALDMFKLVRKYQDDFNITTMGTEFLILAMFETKDSLCHFLLSDYDCNKEEIEEITKNTFILRKKEGE